MSLSLENALRSYNKGFKKNRIFSEEIREAFENNAFFLPMKESVHFSTNRRADGLPTSRPSDFSLEVICLVIKDFDCVAEYGGQKPAPGATADTVVIRYIISSNSLEVGNHKLLLNAEGKKAPSYPLDEPEVQKKLDFFKRIIEGQLKEIEEWGDLSRSSGK